MKASRRNSGKPIALLGALQSLLHGDRTARSRRTAGYALLTIALFLTVLGNMQWGGPVQTPVSAILMAALVLYAIGDVVVARSGRKLVAVKLGNRYATRRARGQSLVEFALVSFFLFFMIMGVIEMARFLFVYNVISNAAQEGSRYGIVRPREVVPNALVTYVSGNPTYRGTVIPTQIVVANGPCDVIDKAADKIYGIPRSDVQITFWYDKGDETPLPLANLNDLDAAATFGNRIVVQTSYRFDFILPFISKFAPNGINVQMRSARTLRTKGNSDAPPCDFAGGLAPPPDVGATQTARAGATQTAQAVATATVGAGWTQTAIVAATQTAAGATPTATATLPPCTPTSVAIYSISAFIKNTGGSNPLKIRVHVTDNCGTALALATVTGVVKSNGSPVGTPFALPNLGGGDYGGCGIGSYNYAGTMTIDVTAANPPLTPAAATGSISGASTCP